MVSFIVFGEPDFANTLVLNSSVLALLLTVGFGTGSFDAFAILLYLLKMKINYACNLIGRMPINCSIWILKRRLSCPVTKFIHKC
jgi:hypothetical protein